MKYKFLRSKFKSDSGNEFWKLNTWKHIDGELDICRRGFHCSRYPDQALSYVQGEILAVVQTKGKSIIQEDKECWSDMKIVKAYRWTKTDSVALAIYAAELVIDIFEKEYPNDDRPRKAIEAAKAYLKSPTKKNANAANAAVYAAYAAVYAAYAAVYAAYAAASAYAAVYAANAAASASASASASAARKEIVKKIRAWMIKRIKVLKPHGK